MKRRKFLQVVGAAAVATPLLSYAATKSPSVEEVFAAKRRLDAGPDKHSVLIVVPSGREADAIHKQMGRPRNVKVIGVGAMLCGYGADYIITDDECAKLDAPFGFYKKRVNKMRADEWHDHCVKPRLTPHGSHIQSRFDIKSFNYGTETGLEMRFIDLDREEVSNDAIRVYKLAPSHEDVIYAKANLYKRWIQQRGIEV